MGKTRFHNAENLHYFLHLLGPAFLTVVNLLLRLKYKYAPFSICFLYFNILIIIDSLRIHGSGLYRISSLCMAIFSHASLISHIFCSMHGHVFCIGP